MTRMHFMKIIPSRDVNTLVYHVLNYFCLFHISSQQVAVAVTCSWLIFRNPISAMNAVGCSVTLVGCTFYGYVRHLLSQQLPGTPRTPRTPRNRIELAPLIIDKLDDKV